MYAIEDYLLLPDAPGVYRIHCLTTNRFYIGCSTKMQARVKSHYENLHIGTGTNQRMTKDFQRYSENAFICGVLEECEEKDIFVREQYWLDRCAKKNRSRMYNENLRSCVPYGMQDRCIDPNPDRKRLKDVCNVDEFSGNNVWIVIIRNGATKIQMIVARGRIVNITENSQWKKGIPAYIPVHYYRKLGANVSVLLSDGKKRHRKQSNQTTSEEA